MNVSNNDAQILPSRSSRIIKLIYAKESMPTETIEIISQKQWVPTSMIAAIVANFDFVGIPFSLSVFVRFRVSVKRSQKMKLRGKHSI